MKVMVKTKDYKGTVKYDQINRKFTVDFPDVETTRKITKFLSTEREFMIPESARIDDYRVEKRLPSASLMHAELSLCNMYAEIGVYVLWDTQKP